MKKAKETTIYDIADKLDVSIATVSRALKGDPVVNKKTRKKIIDLADKMGYRMNHFARNLRNQSTNTIGVIVPRLNSYFMATVIAGIESIANREGFNLIISQSSESFTKEIASAKTMYNNRVDGLLVSLANDTENLNHFEQFAKLNIPIIFFDRTEDLHRFTDIMIDNRKAAYEATSHLISQGCKNIVHITASSQRNVYIDRFNGFKQALKDHGLDFKKENLIINGLNTEDGNNVLQMLQTMNPFPDGVFAANDSCAAGCIIELKKAGYKIPEDIAVVGFNDDPVASVVEPNLTTIHYPADEMGKAAARRLINHLKGVMPIHTTETILLKPELVIRESSLRKK